MRPYDKDGDEFLISEEPLFLGRRCGASGGAVRDPAPVAKTHRTPRILFVASGWT